MKKQFSFFKPIKKDTKFWWVIEQGVYGGSMNYRKIKRPFDPNKLTHAVFKAKLGKTFWFTRRKTAIKDLIEKIAKRYGVTIKDIAINHDHIHLLFYTKMRVSQTRFLRLVAGEMGRRYKALYKKAGIASQGLWESRPFTRLVSWGRKSLEIVLSYFKKNRDEAMGFAKYTPRKHALSDFLKRWTRQSGFSSA